jgi:hypothetical protein
VSQLWYNRAQIFSVQTCAVSNGANYRVINNGGYISSFNGGIFCLYCRKYGHKRKIVFKLKRKEGQNNNHSDNNGDVVFTATLKNGTLSDDIWICVLECISHILNPNMDSVKLNVCALISNSKCENSDENYYVLAIV